MRHTLPDRFPPLRLAVLIAALFPLVGCAPTTRQPPTSPAPMPANDTTITPFLMFEGNAEEAMTFYLSLFPDARVESIDRYGPDEPGAEGTIRHATFTLAGRQYMCSDSYVSHGFTFTPSLSLFVTCPTETELDRLFAALSEDGQVLMPPADYGFSSKFAWVSDRFGVSWQLNLPGE